MWQRSETETPGRALSPVGRCAVAVPGEGTKLKDKAAALPNWAPTLGSQLQPQRGSSMMQTGPIHARLRLDQLGLPARRCYVRVGVGSAVSSRLLLSGREQVLVTN